MEVERTGEPVEDRTVGETAGGVTETFVVPACPDDVAEMICEDKTVVGWLTRKEVTMPVRADVDAAADVAGSLDETGMAVDADT
jgi:hypothetical protein